MFYEIGVLMSLCVAIKLAIYIWNNFNRKDFKWDTGNGRYWAVVTGSTDGIGLEFAKQLAKKGYNLMLISRNPSKLEGVRDNMLAEYPNIQIRTHTADFGETDIYDGIEQFLDINRNDIYVLVNNVGVSTKTFQHFVDADPSEQHKMININVISVVRMTQLVLPSMKSKRRGLILNVSSLAGSIPVPSFALYSGTKALVTQFSRTLNVECDADNVLVYTLCPGPIYTNIVKNFTSHTSYLIPLASDFVANALKQVNWTVTESTGYPMHTFMNVLGNILHFLLGFRLASIMFEYLSRLGSKV